MQALDTSMVLELVEWLPISKDQMQVTILNNSHYQAVHIWAQPNQAQRDWKIRDRHKTFSRETIPQE